MYNIYGCQLNTSWAIVSCIYIHVRTILKDSGINKEKEICVPNKECEMFMNCSKNIMAFGFRNSSINMSHIIHIN